MDKVLDAVIEQLDIIKDIPYDEGGFLDEIDLPDNVWFDDPKILAENQYPFMFVEPVNSVKVNETTKDIERSLTIRIGLVVDPRLYYDASEVTETSASREMIRTVEAIRRHFERTSLRVPNGLSENTTSLEVGSTDYLQQLRGDLYARSAQITLSVRKKYLRLP
jgi:hypothetical protein